jgi:hypothetical protein
LAPTGPNPASVAAVLAAKTTEQAWDTPAIEDLRLVNSPLKG